MEEKQGFFKRLKKGLTKTRDSFVSGVDSLSTDIQKLMMTFMTNWKSYW